MSLITKNPNQIFKNDGVCTKIPNQNGQNMQKLNQNLVKSSSINNLHNNGLYQGRNTKSDDKLHNFVKENSNQSHKNNHNKEIIFNSYDNNNTNNIKHDDLLSNVVIREFHSNSKEKNPEKLEKQVDLTTKSKNSVDKSEKAQKKSGHNRIFSYSGPYRNNLIMQYLKGDFSKDLINNNNIMNKVELITIFEKDLTK